MEGDIEIAAGAVLTFDRGSYINQRNRYNIVNSGSVILNSGSQLNTLRIVSGLGTFIYNRNLATSNGYLVSSPFAGQDIDAFVLVEGLQTFGSNVALARNTTNNNAWNYYQSGDSGTGDFKTGIGHSINLASDGNVAFSGGFQNNDARKNLITSGAGYNLLGNPYSTQMESSEILGLDANSSLLQTETIYVWNQSRGVYQTKNVENGFKVSPAQGFFVQSNGTAGKLYIGKSSQTTSADTFQRQETDETFRIDLNLTDGTTIREAFLNYRDRSAIGFDNGYDAPIFDGISNPFTIYTHAVSNGKGRDLEIQSLPDNNYENMIVPIGINAVSGSEITITPNITNRPTGLRVYIEDKEDESFTLLENSSSFTATISTDMKGIGRFYIHTTSNVLGTDDTLLNNNLSVYTSIRTNLRVVGV